MKVRTSINIRLEALPLRKEGDVLLPIFGQRQSSLGSFDVRLHLCVENPAFGLYDVQVVVQQHGQQ